MAPSTTPAATNLGFLTVLHEPTGYLGGYLVTNEWGRPLEFRLSTAVQPNRVHEVLYGATLKPYVYADVIGKALVEKTASSVYLIITDCEPVLELRPRLQVPVVWLANGNSSSAVCHRRYPQDQEPVRAFLKRLEEMLDLHEPFARIREAIGEARKSGTGGRSKAAA